MALVKDWLDNFMVQHKSRFRPPDWPEPATEDEREFQRLWHHAFRSNSVMQREADVASLRLGVKPPRFAADHLAAIIEEIKDFRAGSRQPQSPDTREGAEQASHDCPNCGGHGTVTVYSPILTSGRCQAHCQCPKGRWLRDTIRKGKHPELLHRIPDWDDVVSGRSAYSLDDQGSDLFGNSWSAQGTGHGS